MIKDLIPLNFPSGINLNNATITMQDMAEQTISVDIAIDGALSPDFSYDWEIDFRGTKFIMPLRKTQGSKENTSLNATYQLTFQHWAIYQLKRWLFFTVPDVDSKIVLPNKYDASVSLNLGDFCNLFNQVLNYYFKGKITIDLNDDYIFDSTAIPVSISNNYLWDVLIKIYDLYGVRWVIAPALNNDNVIEGSERYIIKVGYPTTEISHIFKYGFKGGLMKVERQVQDENIRNMLLGRGGSQNLPFRYFKKHDDKNKSYSPDPDWIPELSTFTFTELFGATFRSYIQGWKAAHIKQYREEYPDEEWIVSTPNAEDAYAPWAWMRGNTDEVFNPTEFVADEFTIQDNGYGINSDSSIARYGELLGILSNNEDIYPTIQGVEIDGLGRIDESVDIEKITSDNIEEDSENNAKINNLDVKDKFKSVSLPKSATVSGIELFGGHFTVPYGVKGNLQCEVKIEPKEGVVVANILSASIVVKNTSNGKVVSAVAIPPGNYLYYIVLEVENLLSKQNEVRLYLSNANIIQSDLSEKPINSWDIWIKNVWGTSKEKNESEEEYATRVWNKILGSSNGDEARIAFSDGWLSISEDYEFKILSVHYDPSKKIISDGVEYPSHWRLNLAKCDADLESTGLYIPSTKLQAEAGDHFYFLGIDMPHLYVTEAEKRLDDWKKDNLNEKKDIKPTMVVSLDKIRIAQRNIEDKTYQARLNLEKNGILKKEDNGGFLFEDVGFQRLSDLLNIGNTFTLEDHRFIEGSHQEKYYIQSVTYRYTAPDDNKANLLPDVEIVLSDKYETSANPVTQLSGEISNLQRQLGSISRIEQLIRQVGDVLYLRKDGFPDKSFSPTEFAGLLTSHDFVQGLLGGVGWGFYRDSNGRAVIETDYLNVRKDFSVNNLVVNQIQARGGMIIESAASMEVIRVWDSDEGVVCQFDTKGGTIANLFRVDDIAYCHRFTPENNSLKYYKRKVVAVDIDSITLSETIKDGDGLPDVGDVIVQYGNYTDKTRQFVKVRDVIDGGYERYIENIDSVTSEGTEYYYIGKQTSRGYRFFLGNKEEDYIEWVNGKLSIKGELSMQSTISGSDKTLGDTLGSMAVETKVLYRQTSSMTTTPQLPILSSEGKIAAYNGWTATPPERTDGMYLWQLTHTIYADKRGELSAPICTTGASGTDGENAMTYELRPRNSSIVRKSDGSILPEWTYVDLYEHNGSSTPKKVKWGNYHLYMERLNAEGSAVGNGYYIDNDYGSGGATIADTSIVALRFSYLAEPKKPESVITQCIVPIVVDPVSYKSFFDNTAKEFTSIKEREDSISNSISKIEQTATNISLSVQETRGWKNYLPSTDTGNGWEKSAASIMIRSSGGAMRVWFATTGNVISPSFFLTPGKYIFSCNISSATTDTLGVTLYDSTGAAVASDTMELDGPYRPVLEVTQSGWHKLSVECEITNFIINKLMLVDYVSYKDDLQWHSSGEGVQRSGISISRDEIVLDSANTVVTGALSQYGLFVKRPFKLTDFNASDFTFPQRGDDMLDFEKIGSTFIDISEYTKGLIYIPFWEFMTEDERDFYRGIDGTTILFKNNSSESKGITGGIAFHYLDTGMCDSGYHSVVVEPNSIMRLTARIFFDREMQCEWFAFCRDESEDCYGKVENLPASWPIAKTE